MRNLIWFALIFLLQPIAAQEMQNFIQQELDSFPENCEVAIGIIHVDKESVYGFRKTGDTIIPVNNNMTLFEIGSMTKTFTGALLMNEVESGRIRLDDPVQDHLEVLIRKDTFAGNQLQIIHLATHTSGLKFRPFMSFKRYAAYLERFELDYIPGRDWRYNNLAIALMGHIVMNTSQTTWAQALHEEILDPLGMVNTYVNSAEAPESNRMQCVDKRGRAGDCHFELQNPFIWPSGGMVSNIDDLMRWLRINIETSASELTFIQAAHDPLGDSIINNLFPGARQGIVWWHVIDEHGNRILAHGGTTPDHSSFIVFDKERRAGVVVYTNVTWTELQRDGELLVSRLAFDILEKL